jgi:PAS domain S-box-containing protein
MTSEPSGQVEAGGHLSTGIHPPGHSGVEVNQRGNIGMSPGLVDDLLNLEAWNDILATYARTLNVAVALTDPQGQILGMCHNARPVWTLVHDAQGGWGSGCPFCIARLPCGAIAEALETGRSVMARDEAGLAHVAVPLLLGKQRVGAIVAGQVFERYPEPLSLQRVAREFGVSSPQLWYLARKQGPVSSSLLRSSGDLLCALGHAFLQQRYGAILEGRLAETNNRFRLLVEGVKDHALFTLDLNGRVTSWNYGAERLLGYLDAEIIGENFSRMFTATEIENCVPEKQLRIALEAGRSDDEGWRVTAGKKQFWASVGMTIVSDPSAQVHGFVIIMQDVTERKRIAIALEEAQQARVRLQEKFLSHVSHELRTPLTAIYFFTTNVLDGLLGDLTPEQREHLSLAVDNVKQLKDMVSDLLDITRVETHKLTVEPQHASSVKLIADVLNTCRTNAAVKHISLRADIAPGLPFVWADPTRVRQILINLIENGIKFTPEDGTITVASQAFTEDPKFLRLSVSDTGCGISVENREIIFDRLAQVKGGIEASRSGLGLGLFIAKDLVSQHGGRIWVESNLGEGSTFCFTLPVFSMAELCAHVLTTSNMDGGYVTLIRMDMTRLGEASQTDSLLTEIREVLKHCIHAGRDVLLPSTGDVEPVETIFIVACADASGFEVIERRIRRELDPFVKASRLKFVISSTTLLVTPGRPAEEQVKEITERLEQLIQSHLQSKERPK